MSEDELQQDLIRLLNKYDSHRSNPATWENLSSDTKKQIKGIVGFKVKVNEVQASYKLSQNRSQIDYQNIIDELYKEERINSKQLADVMEKRKQNKCIGNIYL